MLAVATAMVLPLHSGNEKLKKLNEKIEKRQADPALEDCRQPQSFIQFMTVTLISLIHDDTFHSISFTSAFALEG